MKDKEIQSSHERASGDCFIETYNRERCTKFAFKEQPCPPQPDLIYYDKLDNKIIGIEITDAYYCENDAKGTWDMARGKVSCSTSACLINPDKKLAQFINDRITTKCNNVYDFSAPIVLLIISRPALTESDQDFKDNILPYVSIPNYVPFCDVYLDLDLLSSHHYFHLYKK